MNDYISCSFYRGPEFLISDRLSLNGRVYNLEDELLGRGGNGLVYKCSDAVSGDEYAIKIVNTFYENVRTRFDRECKNLQACSGHSNIINIYGFGELSAKRRLPRSRKYIDDKLRWCLMELAEDGNLSAHLARSDSISFSEYSAHIRGLASALEYLHDKNILHRDIKPENILISGEKWLLSDFGLTAPIDRSGEDLTEIDDKIGPRFWMSPEATNKALGCSGENSDICTQSDVFQLASVIWFVINNAHPLGVIEEEDYKGKKEIYDVLYSSLKHNPEQRPANGKVFHEKIATAIEA